jgi:hypothetical protein
MTTTIDTRDTLMRLARLRHRLRLAQEANLNWPSSRREDLIDHINNEIKQIENKNQLCTQY